MLPAKYSHKFLFCFGAAYIFVELDIVPQVLQVLIQKGHATFACPALGAIEVVDRALGHTVENKAAHRLREVLVILIVKLSHGIPVAHPHQELCVDFTLAILPDQERYVERNLFGFGFRHEVGACCDFKDVAFDQLVVLLDGALVFDAILEH